MKQYCIACQREAFFKCACCHDNTFYCGKACQEADYDFLHKHEPLFGASSTTEETNTRKETRPKIKPQSIPETMADRQDRWIRTEFQRVAYAMEEAFKEWQITPPPVTDTKTVLDGLTEAQTMDVIVALVKNFDSVSANKEKNDKRLRYINKLDDLGQIVSSINGKYVALISETPQLKVGIARYFRMNDLLTEKQKLVFLRNSEQDRAEYIEWVERTEEYHKKFVWDWLFADSCKGVTSLDALQQHIKAYELANIGIQVAEKTLERHRKAAYEYLEGYAVYSLERERKNGEFFLGGKDDIGNDGGKGGDKDDDEETCRTRMYRLLDNIKSVFKRSPVSYEDAKKTTAGFIDASKNVELAKLESQYVTGREDENENSRGYLHSFYDTVRDSLISHDGDNSEIKKLKREIAEKLGVPLDTIKKIFTTRIAWYFVLLVGMMAITGFSFGAISDIYYSEGPQMRSNIKHLQDTVQNIKEQVMTVIGMKSSTREAAKAFESFAGSIEKPEGLYHVVSKADMGSPLLMATVNTQVRGLIDSVSEQITSFTTAVSSGIIHTDLEVDQYNLFVKFQNDYLKVFLDTMDPDISYQKLNAIIRFLQTNEKALGNRLISPEKIVAHIQQMRTYFTYLYPDLTKIGSALTASKEKLEEIAETSLPNILKQMYKNDKTAGMVESVLGERGKAWLSGTVWDHAVNNIGIDGLKNLLPDMGKKVVIDQAIALEVASKGFYRKIAHAKLIDWPSFTSLLGYMFTGYLNPVWIGYFVVGALDFVIGKIPTFASDAFLYVVAKSGWSNVVTYFQKVDIQNENKNVEKLREDLRNPSEEQLRNLFDKGTITLRELYRLLHDYDAYDYNLNYIVSQERLKTKEDVTGPLKSLLKGVMLSSVVGRFAYLFTILHATVVTITMSVFERLRLDTLASINVDLILVPMWLVYVLYWHSKEPKTSLVMKLIWPTTRLFEFYRTHVLWIEGALAAITSATSFLSWDLDPIISGSPTVKQNMTQDASWMNDTVNIYNDIKGINSTVGLADINITAINMTVSNVRDTVKGGGVFEFIPNIV